MATYVLVGGAWPGGWCWQKVARRLRDNGHDAWHSMETQLYLFSILVLASMRSLIDTNRTGLCSSRLLGRLAVRLGTDVTEGALHARPGGC